MSDPQKAADVYRAWKRMYPGSLVPTTNLAVILSDFMGQYDAALPEAREAVRLGPYSSIARGVLTLTYLGSGRMSEARQTVADAVKIGINDRVMSGYAFDLALFDGDTAAIEREVRRAAANPATELTALQSRASAAMASGRLREGRRLWAEAATRAADIGPGRLVAETHLLWAESEALLGDARQARKAAERALTEDRSATTHADAAVVIALAGDAARARSILDSASGQTALGPFAVLAGVPIARALVESRLGHGASAAALLQPVVRFENGRLCGPLALGARGLVALSGHRSSEAIGALANLLSRRVLYPVSPWVPYARVALARALLESGDTARGLAAYDDFLASWKGADADAPLLNVVRRERAAVAAR
jgi:hypothetical protein